MLVNDIMYLSDQALLAFADVVCGNPAKNVHHVRTGEQVRSFVGRFAGDLRGRSPRDQLLAFWRHINKQGGVELLDKYLTAVFDPRDYVDDPERRFLDAEYVNRVLVHDRRKIEITKNKAQLVVAETVPEIPPLVVVARKGPSPHSVQLSRSAPLSVSRQDTMPGTIDSPPDLGQLTVKYLWQHLTISQVSILIGIVFSIAAGGFTLGYWVREVEQSVQNIGAKSNLPLNSKNYSADVEFNGDLECRTLPIH